MSELPAARLGDRSLFPDLAVRAYLNHAGVSPPSRPVQRAVSDLLGAYARSGSEAVLATLALRSRLRERAARLLGVAAADVALTGGATHGVQAIALSFPWRRGDRLVLLEGEFPANVTPWQRAAELFGLEPRFVPMARFLEGDEVGMAAVEDELAAGARLVAASAVHFATGLPLPLAALARTCARHGAQLFVDAIQALGAVPLDAAALGVDYLACGAHKWLMGAEGAGFLFVRSDRVAALRPALAGWLSHEEPIAFLLEPGRLRHDRPLRREASVFEAGSSSALSQAALDASLALLLELGPAAIHAHVNRYLDRLEPLLAARGFQSRRAREPARRSGILSALPPPGRSPREIRQVLSEAGVAVATPDGHVRFAPHWPNDPDRELPVVAAALDAACG